MKPAHGKRRLKALTLLAAASFVTGAAQGAHYVSTESETASRFVAAWQQNNYKKMYSLIDERSRSQTPFTRFVAAYRSVAATATVKSLKTGPIREASSNRFTVPLRFETEIFGTVTGEITLTLSSTGEKTAIAWKPHLTFPYLSPGRTLNRSTELPARAPILTRDGTPLAEGQDRSSPLGSAASQLVGSLGPPPSKRERELYEAGFPSGVSVGVSGLELVFNRALAGRPGGKLTAGGRTVASSKPRAAKPLRTTIDSKLQRSAETALAGRYGGIAVLKPGTGEILALAGIASSAPQPPGSTFKIVTLAAALEAKLVKPTAVFPYLTAATIEGVDIGNAHGESCGGTLTDSFAKSCNSVFAPLGAKLGANRLVAMAERFGFNESPPLLGAAESTIPSAETIGDSLAVGSSAIGQGRVQATPLQIASVAATIAAEGRRFQPTLTEPTRPVGKRVVSRKVALTVERMMVAAVRYGTGKTAAIPGVEIAGKTGTAELESKEEPQQQVDEATSGQADSQQQEPPKTDAWFAAYGPAKRPQVAVAVMLVEGGAGGDTAAPAARQVLLAALGK